MDLHKSVFTTFEAASICHANVTSIKNWIDQGKLNAFRTPGGHYRIPRSDLDAFLHAHGMPNPLRDPSRIVVALSLDALAESLIEHLSPRHECIRTTNAVSTLLTLGMELPDAIILSSTVLSPSTLESLLHELDNTPDIPNPHILLLTDTPPRYTYDALTILAPTATAPSIIDALQPVLLVTNAYAP